MAQTSENTQKWVARAVGRFCSQHAPNIHMASFFLPPRKRVALQAVGGFLHLLEEAMDVPPSGSASGACASASELEGRTAMVLERIDRMYGGEFCDPELGGRPEDAVISVVSAAIQRYQIPRQWFLDLIDGLKLRATKLRWATWSSLQKYLRSRGGSSALIVSAVLGLTHSDAQERAAEMGMAIELTRLLRDLKNDLAKNRLLMPLEDLIRFKYSEKEMMRGVLNENFVQLIKLQIDRARELYRAGAQGIAWVAGDGSRICAATMAVLYCGLLKDMERKSYDVFAPIRLTAAQRARRMVDAWRLARGGSARGWEKR